ncbi:BTAD domain-containing putative transcriptional regulator [Nonomuraea sp. NPDC049152]|uniref:AfsR/SARP family transcriptional regulator n=1 Tax=Nonomuraea sp. NPDC049152 TaxID=3154350 RepID=UPI00341194E5
MRFGVLGSTEVAGFPLRGARLSGLLVLLALEAGRVVPVERLINDIYGPSGTVNALQSQVSRLRGLVGVPLELGPAGYRLVVDPLEVDAHLFARLVADARRTPAAGERSRLLREALGLWRGQALADVRGLPFAEGEAARLEELRLGALEDRVEADLLDGSAPAGELVAELGGLVRRHPLRERLRGQHMRALAAAGRRAEALEAFEEARRTLAEELGADPSPELAELHVRLLSPTSSHGTARSGASPPVTLAPTTPVAGAVPPDARLAGVGGGASASGAAASGASAESAGAGAVLRPRGPRQQPTSFVGREKEVRLVRELLEQGRLLTLAGPGGAGKTRLAVEAAAGLGEVCFVELAPLGPGSDVALAVLTALGLPQAHTEPPGPLTLPGAKPPADVLMAALDGHSVTLVLDNCEHLVEAAALLADRILAERPRVRILATSREPFNIPGEQVLPVTPLPRPPHDLSPAEAREQPAVRLLADRAGAVRHGFAVTEANLDAVSRICRALDGLPLAIELAAARLRALTPEEVAARLDDRFGLLTGGSRTALPRHRTLRAVVAWSWDLLDPAERELAASLSVFASGATAHAAERVCGGDLDLLAALVDKSILQADGGRFRMLETVRAFCAERLAESGEQERVRLAHAECFAAMAAAAEPQLRGPDQLRCLAELVAEHDNLRTALRFAIDTGRIELALRLVADLWMYWWLRGIRHEGAAVSVEVLDLVGPEPPPSMVEEYIVCSLQLAAGGGPVHRELRDLLANAERLAEGLSERPRNPLVAMVRPYASIADGDYTRLLPALLAGTTDSDPWTRAFARLLVGYLRLGAGEVEAGERELRMALDTFRVAGDRWGVGQAMLQLSELSGWRGDHAAAIATAEEALEVIAPFGAAEDTALVLSRRGAELARAGDLEAARAELERAAALVGRLPVSEAACIATYGLAELARLAGDCAQAAALYARALEDCSAHWLGANETRGRILIGIGRLERSGPIVREAHDLLVKMIDLPGASGAVEAMAELTLREGAAARAAFLLGAAESLRGVSLRDGPDVARTAGDARRELGDAAFDRSYRRGRETPRDQIADLLPY